VSRGPDVTTCAVDCGPCGLAGVPLRHLDEADQLGAVHDHLHHRGRPTAEVRALSTSDTEEANPRWATIDPAVTNS
jgi:hypothetical protein